MNREIEVGQKVYVTNHKGLEELIVTRVGRKYFYATLPEIRWERQFILETMRENQDYGSPATVYPTLTEYEEEKELYALFQRIREAFSRHGKPEITLMQAREIHAILFGEVLGDE